MPDLSDGQLDQLISDIGLKPPRGRHRKPIAHGELKGAKQHRYRKESLCEPCRLAEAAYQRARHRARHHPEWLDDDNGPTEYLTEEQWQARVAARKAGGSRG